MKKLLVPVVLALLATGCTAPATSPTTETPTASQDASAGAAPTPGQDVSAGAAPTPSQDVSAGAAPPPAALPADEFTLDTRSGAKIAFKLPTPATDPALAELEAFRKKTGGQPVSYIVADVDNRNGTAPVDMNQINAFDKEGREYTFGAVADVLETWTPVYRNDFEYKLADGTVVDQATGSAMSREATELRNSNPKGADVAERATIILVAPDVDLPEEFTRVSVRPSGAGEGEDAVPVQR